MLLHSLHVAANILQENCNLKLETYICRSHDHLWSKYATILLMRDVLQSLSY